MLMLADESNINELVSIEKECFFAPYSENILLEILKNPQSDIAVWKEDGKVIGYISGQLILDEYEMNNVAVLKDFRGKGIGKELVLWLIDHAELRNAKTMLLEVNENNEVALRLYRSIGFNQIGLRKKYYGNDSAILMRMTLKS